MSKKSPGKSPYRTTTVAFYQNYILNLSKNPVFRAVLACTAGTCLLLAVILILCGLASRNSVPYYVLGIFLLLPGALLATLYLWIRHNLWKQKLYSVSAPTIATICDNYYNQVPPGKKSDYPMGPLLVMTLPRRKRQDFQSPNSLKHKKLTKNIPPLASEETLSPSLCCSSSSSSISSVV